MFALVGLAVVLLLGAQPAFAYIELGTTGTVGVHSLVDTSSTPGAECRYRYLSGENLWQLRRMLINPPRMRAVAGQGLEKVSWHYTIQRRFWSAFSSRPGPWANRFTSIEFIAYTDSTHNASFSQQSASVSVPLAPGGDAVAEYRAFVKLTWYKASGAVLGTATDRIEWYYADKGSADTVLHRTCTDYEV
jgi:hypothetical protein